MNHALGLMSFHVFDLDTLLAVALAGLAYEGRWGLVVHGAQAGNVAD